MNRNKKGFTLVELLAVIIILAALVVITAPIVINITEKSEDETLLLAANMYLDAVTQATMNKNLEEKGTFDPTLCEVNEGGSLICDDTIEVELEVNGQLSSSGTIKLKNHNITSVKLNYGEDTIIKSKSGELMYFENEYKIGQIIEYTYRDGYTDNGYVIDEEVDSVTVLQEYTRSCWISNSDSSSFHIRFLECLNNATMDFTYVEPIDNYVYKNNSTGKQNFGYQKLEIKNGQTKIISEDGTTETVINGTARARLITLEEIFEISMELNSNLTEGNLRDYIERNLSLIKSHYGLNSIYTVDELLQRLETDGFDYGNYYRNLYFIVLDAKSNGIESNYDISLAKWLCRSSSYYNYLIATSFKNNNLYLSRSCEIVTVPSNEYSTESHNYRYVITIPKDKIK